MKQLDEFCIPLWWNADSVCPFVFHQTAGSNRPTSYDHNWPFLELFTIYTECVFLASKRPINCRS